MSKEPKEKERKQQKGFTLIELLLAMALIAILATTAIQVTQFSETQKNLTLANDQVRQAIRIGQSYSLAVPNYLAESSPTIEHICGFGIHFDIVNRNYFFYYNALEAATYNTDPGGICQEVVYEGYGAVSKKMGEVISLPTGINLKSGSDTDVYFHVPYGNSSGVRTITLQDDNLKESTISILHEGNIE